jgi:hypothetical protein
VVALLFWDGGMDPAHPERGANPVEVPGADSDPKVLLNSGLQGVTRCAPPPDSAPQPLGDGSAQLSGMAMAGIVKRIRAIPPTRRASSMEIGAIIYS